MLCLFRATLYSSVGQKFVTVLQCIDYYRIVVMVWSSWATYHELYHIVTHCFRYILYCIVSHTGIPAYCLLYVMT